ncbi:MAG: sensor histidine kinase [Geobacter sp.]|nr:sensor histidine kinase [Geobacter sp.]
MVLPDYKNKESAIMDTYFAPAKRIERRILRNQIESICNSVVMDTLLTASNGLMVVVNDARQIVALNKSFIQTLGISDPEQALGLRLGETLHCKYAFDEPNGCGTTKYCSSCGAVIAILAAIDDNKACEKICAVTIEKHGKSSDICLLVRALPLVVDGNRWVLVYAQDVSQQQFWANLENAFFHDLNNMICAMKNYSSYLHDQMPVNPYSLRQKMLAERMFQEVRMQGKLSHLKSTESIVDINATSLVNIRNQAFNIVLVSNAMDGKTIKEESPADELTFETDAMLVSKVLINMLLNALEATEPGGHVIFRTLVEDARVTWQVWNSAVIPDNIQLRIFQRFFSTKHELGHGLGTYSMKLFGEECLGGKVSFTSTADEGTVFSFSLPV